MNKHTLRMVIGCILPLLLIFVLPYFDVSNQVTIVVFLVLMFACHLFMPHGHGDHQKQEPNGETEHEIPNKS